MCATMVGRFSFHFWRQAPPHTRRSVHQTRASTMCVNWIRNRIVGWPNWSKCWGCYFIFLIKNVGRRTRAHEHQRILLLSIYCSSHRRNSPLHCGDVWCTERNNRKGKIHWNCKTFYDFWTSSHTLRPIYFVRPEANCVGHRQQILLSVETKLHRNTHRMHETFRNKRNETEKRKRKKTTNRQHRTEHCAQQKCNENSNERI